MSLQTKIMELITGLRDPMMRVDVAATINYMSDLFNMGKISEEELFENLTEICMTVFKETKKGLDEEALKDIAEKEANELIKAIKLSGLRRRMSARYGLRL